MTQMTTDEKRMFERGLRAKLSVVRYVFELGFPDDLVQSARDVVASSARAQQLFNGDDIRYPACLILSVVAAARHYDGQAFWTSDDVQSLNLSPTDISRLTVLAMEFLGLDTFAAETHAEKARGRLSPVLMHAGVPAANVGDLVRLIASAQRQHVFGPEEQIALWSRTPNGFRGLWRAPQLFFKYGGSAAVDLLDRLNDSLATRDPLAAGLPSHLSSALDALDDEVVRSVTRAQGRSIRHPLLTLDPWSCDGPAVQLPPVHGSLATRWFVTGGSIPQLAVRPEVVDVPLDPLREWEVSARTGVEIVARWSYVGYFGNPAIFFDGQTRQLLRRRANRIEVTSGSMLALLHPRVELVGILLSDNEYPPLAGRWSGWRIVEYQVVSSITATSAERGRPETEESIEFVRTAQRPVLSDANLVSGAMTLDGRPVYSSAPMLHISLGSSPSSAIRVDITDDTGMLRSSSLSALGDTAPFDLSPLMPTDGKYTVDVRGPLGLSMRPVAIAIVEGLRAEVEPTVSTINTALTVTLRSATHQQPTVYTAGPGSTHLDLDYDGTSLRISTPRISWATRSSGEISTELRHDPVLIGIDDLDSLSPVLLSVSLGAAVYSRLELRDATATLMSLEPPRITDRWTVALNGLRDTAVRAGVESLSLVLIAGSHSVSVGSVIATYRPTLSNVRSDGTIEPAIIEVDIDENMPFRSRVVRLWELDRPWERSLRVPINDDRRGSLQIPLPDHHRTGRYRLWLRVEEAWASEPVMPRAGQAGAVDVVVKVGALPNRDSPIDRIVEAATSSHAPKPHDGDVRDHGHLLLALLALGLRQEGTAWLTSPRAGRVLNLLESEPEGLPRSLARAMLEQFVGRDEAFGVSLATLPLLLELERRVNLRLESGDSELMWSEMPLAAAAIEPWTDGVESSERWSRHVGWPRLDFDDVTDDPQATLNKAPLPPIPEDFQSNARAIASNPVFRDYYDQLTGLSDRPLTVDFRFRSLVDVLLNVSAKESEGWINKHSATMQAVIARSSPVLLADLSQSVTLGKGFPDRGLFSRIAELADALVSEPGQWPEVHAALIDAAAIAQSWVYFCLMQAMAIEGTQKATTSKEDRTHNA